MTKKNLKLNNLKRRNKQNKIKMNYPPKQKRKILLKRTETKDELQNPQAS